VRRNAVTTGISSQANYGIDWAARRLKAAVVSPDNVYAATGGWDDSIRVWDLRTGAALLRFAAHHVIHQIAWIPSAPPRLIVGTAGGDVIRVELPGDEVRPGPMAPRGAGP